MHEPPGTGERSPIEVLLTDCPSFMGARVHGSGKTWSAGSLLEAISSNVSALGSPGVRVATLIHDPFLSGLTSLSILAAGGTCLPLNPAWTVGELRAVLVELDVRVVALDDSELLPELWEELDGTVHRVHLDGEQLSAAPVWQGRRAASSPEPGGLILLSSGSTGRPKPVPLSLQQLADAADEIVHSMELGEQDACLNFLPMMHVGGLVDLFLVPLRSGGKVVFCDPRDPAGALQLARREGVTWIQGAPAMLNNLLRVDGEAELPRLRFLRSVSAPLPGPLLERVEQCFGAPVIEMYGMSETAGVITSNPLPPGRRKRGSVGLPGGIELETRHHGAASEDPRFGEIWIRGPRVFRGYLGNHGDAGDWDGDWFRTGDLGWLDEDGYLFLAGRQGEMINRGGQKFSPVELDELCASWPEVLEAAGFAFPHASLGQEVGVALVCEGSPLDRRTVQERVEAQLAPYKVPRRVLLLERLPRNQNGKLERHRLKDISEPRSNPGPYVEGLTPTQTRLMELWRENLNLASLGLDDDYFESGGDSLSATTLLAAIEGEWKVGLVAVDFFEHATVRQLAEFVDQSRHGAATGAAESPPVDLDPEIAEQIQRILQTWPGKPVLPGGFGVSAQGDETPQQERVLLFWACNGSVEYRVLLGASAFRVVAFRTLFELQAREHRELDRLARVYAAEVERIQPGGPLLLGGFCDGAELMERVGRLLVDRGRELRLFIAHDYLPWRGLPGHHAYIVGEGWPGNPAREFPHFAKGLSRHHHGAFGFLSWKGSHSDYHVPEFAAQLEGFLAEQLVRSGASRPPGPGPIRPRVGIRVLNRMPRLLKTGKEHVIEVCVLNRGDRVLEPEDGLTLCARWENHRGKLRVQAPMATPLLQKLGPGEEWHTELRVIHHKPLRLETLKIGFLEEGLDWSWLDYGPPGILTCTLFTF